MRLIDIDELVEEYKRLLQRFEEIGDNSAATAVELCRHKAECVAPTIDAVPVVHAYWKESNRIQGMKTCTNCGAQRNPKFKIGGGAWLFCPNCGAVMDKKEKYDEV